MTIRLEYAGPLRSLLERMEDRVPFADGDTVLSMLARVAGTLPEKAKPHLLTENGHLQPSLLIAINGTASAAAQAETHALVDGDEVVLLPPIAGG